MLIRLFHRSFSWGGEGGGGGVRYQRSRIVRPAAHPVLLTIRISKCSNHSPFNEAGSSRFHLHRFLVLLTSAGASTVVIVRLVWNCFQVVANTSPACHLLINRYWTLFSYCSMTCDKLSLLKLLQFFCGFVHRLTCWSSKKLLTLIIRENLKRQVVLCL